MRRPGQIALVAGAVVLAARWGYATARSEHVQPWNNAWLVVLVLYLLVILLGVPQLVFYGRAHRERTPQDRPRRFAALRYLIVGAAVFFGGSYLLMSSIRWVEWSPGAAIGQRHGDDVAVVTYEVVGPTSMLQILLQRTDSHYVMAIDPDTGKHLWATRISDGFWEPRMVAAGEKYVYVANGDGLTVLDISDGAVIVHAGGIVGLGFDGDDGKDTGDAVGRFLYDAAGSRIIARTETGTQAIPLDALLAIDLREKDALRWQQWYGPGGAQYASSGLATEAAAANMSLEATESGIQVRRPGNDWAPLTALDIRDPARYVDPEIVVSSEPAALVANATGPDAQTPEALGSAGGYIVVSEQLGDDDGHRLSTVRLSTGERIDAVDVAKPPAGGSTSAAGSTVIMLEKLSSGWPEVVLVTPAGELTTSGIGAVGFLGEGQ